MADTKISALSAVATPAGTDEFAVNQSATSKKMTLAQIDTFVLTASVFAAGTASANTHPKLTAGTLLTTPEVGTLELDTTNLYGCTDAGNRGVVPIVHLIRCNVARTLPNDTNSNAIFNSPANGTLTLETGVYFFDLMMLVTAMSATSGNLQINLGGTAVIDSWLWQLSALDTSTPSTSVALLTVTAQSSSTGASCVTAATGTGLTLRMSGTFAVTTGGTLIPQAKLVTAIATASVAIGSYFRCERIGATGLASVGQWT